MLGGKCVFHFTLNRFSYRHYYLFGSYVYGRGKSNSKRSVFVLCVWIVLLISSVVINGNAFWHSQLWNSFNVCHFLYYWKESACLIVVLYAVVFSAYTYFNKIDYWVVDKESSRNKVYFPTYIIWREIQQ